MPNRTAPPNFGALTLSWLLSLRADRKSAQTLKTYSDGVRFYLTWCAEQDVDPLERTSLRSWVTALLDGGNQPATARSRQLAVRRFTAWLAEEGELPADPFLGIKAPQLDSTVVEPLDGVLADTELGVERGCAPSPDQRPVVQGNGAAAWR